MDITLRSDMRSADDESGSGSDLEVDVRPRKNITGSKRSVIEYSDDFDCVLCLKLYYNPVTTSCGHSFCRDCILRALDHNASCPLCRTILHMDSNHPVSVTLKSVIERNFSGEYKKRCEEVKENKILEQSNMPLFFLDTCAFPSQGFPMHIFEPRYKLMLRRCFEGQRRFGLVCCSDEFPNGAPIGTTLDIKREVRTGDGRSYIETCGKDRFRVLSSWTHDGYACGKVEFFYDVKPRADAIELISELANKIRSKVTSWVTSAHSGNSSRGLRQLTEAINSMPVAEDKNEEFSFWVASHMPLDSHTAYKLLSTTSTAERLTLELDLLEDRSGGCSVM